MEFRNRYTGKVFAHADFVSFVWDRARKDYESFTKQSWCDLNEQEQIELYCKQFEYQVDCNEWVWHNCTIPTVNTRHFDDLGRITIPRAVREAAFGTADVSGKNMEIRYRKDGIIILIPCNPSDEVSVVMRALDVEKEDAQIIIEHLTKHGCKAWITSYKESNNDSPLTDVHYENTFEDMIDFKYEEAKPREILSASSNIEDYPEMLQLKDKVIFWYGLV